LSGPSVKLVGQRRLRRAVGERRGAAISQTQMTARSTTNHQSRIARQAGRTSRRLFPITPPGANSHHASAEAKQRKARRFRYPNGTGMSSAHTQRELRSDEGYDQGNETSLHKGLPCSDQPSSVAVRSNVPLVQSVDQIRMRRQIDNLAAGSFARMLKM
jgi:hypothetical protein